MPGHRGDSRSTHNGKSMARTRIKICGITRPEDMVAAVDCGVDAIGLVFANASPRSVDLATAAALRAECPALVTCVALVMNPSPEQLANIVQAVQPDMVQFHGDEPAAVCRAAGLPYIKALGFGSGDAANQAQDYGDAALLLADSHAPGQGGGTGRTFDWTHAADLARHRRLMLAGGLNADNVGAAIRTVAPYAVDVSSGVESGPGLKSAPRIREFVAAVQRADATSILHHRQPTP